MSFSTDVHQLLEAALVQNPALFLIDCSIDTASHIRVVLDGDRGVSMQDCVAVSRHIEHQLDREAHDFSLEVTSVDASAPLQQVRQYLKNVGRKLKVVLKTGRVIEAKLAAADEAAITLTWKSREPKAVGKGKQTVEKIEKIAYEEIEKATVIIQFN